MIYKARPGIVRLRICDMDILASKREIWAECPVIRPLPRMWAACFALMEKGKTSEEVIHAFASLFHKPEEDVRTKLDRIFEELYNEGFLIRIQEDETNE